MVQAKDQLEQHNQHLQRRLQESEAEAAALQSKLSTAASDLEELRAQVQCRGHCLPDSISGTTQLTVTVLIQVATGKASSNSHDTALSNMQIALEKHQEEAAAAAAAHEHAMAKVLADVRTLPPDIPV